MPETKGHCKHGEFDLKTGCPLCIAEREAGEGNTEASIAGRIAAVQHRHYGLAPEPLSEEAREILTGGRDEMIRDATSKALVLRPGEDIEAHGYFEEALEFLKYAKARVITTVEGVKLATDDLALISKLKKVMENKRKSLLEPLELQKVAIRDTYNYLMAPVLEADKITRDKMLDFSKEQDRIRIEQEEINRKRLEAAEAEMRLKGELSEPVNLVEVMPEVKSVSTEMGTTRITTIWKWEVIDLSLVPDEYKILDAAKVGKVVRAGLRSIPGIRIYPDESLRVTTQ